MEKAWILVDYSNFIDFFFFSVLKNTEWEKKEHSVCCRHVLYKKLVFLPAAPQELHGKMLRSLLFLVCFHQHRQCWGNLPKMELNFLFSFVLFSPLKWGAVSGNGPWAAQVNPTAHPTVCIFLALHSPCPAKSHRWSLEIKFSDPD